MNKVVFLVLFFLLTTASSWTARSNAPVHNDVVVSAVYADTSAPVGDAEENSEEDKDITEDEDDLNFDHKWLSRDQTSNSNLHILYQETLFKDLDFEVVVPPPKA